MAINKNVLFLITSRLSLQSKLHQGKKYTLPNWASVVPDIGSLHRVNSSWEKEGTAT